MNAHIVLQNYFINIDEEVYRKYINEKLEESFKYILIDIGLLLETNILIKENEDVRGYVEYAFERLQLENNGEHINCILSVYNIKDGNYYIQMAKKIAQFFDEEFPYEVKNLNLGLPTRNELMCNYELKDENENLLYSSAVCLSNDLSEIRFTIYKD